MALAGLNKHQHGARTMQRGFKAHAVKHEPIAPQLLKQTLELGLQLRFTRFGGCEPVNNRLKIKTAD